MLPIKHGQSREIVIDSFKNTSQEYNFRKNRYFRIPSVNPVFHGPEITSYLGAKIWVISFVQLKEFNTLNSFKNYIKNWAPKNCPCRFCKHYISGAVFFP